MFFGPRVREHGQGCFFLENRDKIAVDLKKVTSNGEEKIESAKQDFKNRAAS